jgi:hypothetical protein
LASQTIQVWGLDPGKSSHRHLSAFKELFLNASKRIVPLVVGVDK